MISTTLDFTSWHGIFFTNFNVLLFYNNEASFKGVSPRGFSFRVHDDNSFYYDFSQLQAFHIIVYSNLLIPLYNAHSLIRERVLHTQL